MKEKIVLKKRSTPKLSRRDMEGLVENNYLPTSELKKYEQLDRETEITEYFLSMIQIY